MRPTKIRVGGVPEHFNLPWTLAVEEDAFAHLNARVSYKEYPEGTGAMTRDLSDNKLDMAIVLSEGAVAHAVKQKDCALVKVFVRSPLIWGIHVAHEGKLRRITDVRGSRYAISRYGSGSHLMAIVDAATRGWSVNDLEFVTVDNIKGAQTALSNGKADVFFWERFITQPLVDAKVFRRVGQRPTPWPCFCVSVRRTLLKRKSQLVRDVLSEVEIYAKRLQRRKSTIEVVQHKYGLKHKDAQQWFQGVRWAGGFSRPKKELRQIIQSLKTVGVLEPGVNDDSVVWWAL
ncbi:MAG: ABC transporter substrate-binding protein [Pseudomonadota bacterium]